MTSVLDPACVTCNMPQGSALILFLFTGSLPQLNAELDDKLSMRPLELDASGYFIILLDKDNREIVAEHYTNTINKNGKWASLCCDDSRFLIYLAGLTINK